MTTDTPFDPDGVGLDNGNYFGMPFTTDEADLVLLSAPWDVTVSYGAGAVYAPDAIIAILEWMDGLEAHMKRDQRPMGLALSVVVHLEKAREIDGHLLGSGVTSRLLRWERARIPCSLRKPHAYFSRWRGIRG